MVKYMFVYGSLMKGFFNYEDHLKGGVIQTKLAKTKGKLYHQVDKGYPAMIDGDDYVYGELILIKDLNKHLPELDSVENYYGENDENNEYNRILKEVEILEDNSKVSAYAYKYNYKGKESLNKEWIYLPDGNWREYMEGEKRHAL